MMMLVDLFFTFYFVFLFLPPRTRPVSSMILYDMAEAKLPQKKKIRPLRRNKCVRVELKV